MKATYRTVVTLIAIISTNAALHADGGGALHHDGAYYIVSGNDNAPMRRNGNGELGVGFEIPSLGSYTQPSGIGIDPVGKKAYYSRISSIYSNNLDGTSPTLVKRFGTTTYTPVRHVEVDPDNERIYFTIDFGDYAKGIYYMNYDGTGVTPVITEALLDATLGVAHDPLLTASSANGIVLDLDSGRLYWGHGGKLMVSTLSGGAAEYLFTFPTGPGRFDIDPVNSKAYYTNGTTEFFRCNLDGTVVESVYKPGFGFPEALEIDTAGERVYFVHNRRIKYTNLDGSAGVTEVGLFGWTRATDMELGPMPDLSKLAMTVKKAPSGGTVKLRTTFNTDPGIKYTIYESLDLKTWTSTGATHIGDGDPAHSHFPFSVDQKLFRVKRESPVE